MSIKNYTYLFKKLKKIFFFQIFKSNFKYTLHMSKKSQQTENVLIFSSFRPLVVLETSENNNN